MTNDVPPGAPRQQVLQNGPLNKVRTRQSKRQRCVSTHLWYSKEENFPMSKQQQDLVVENSVL
jgi:hypothetical protein